MMNEFRTAKEAYDQTPIPQELNERVQAGIRQGSEAYRSAHRRVALRRTLTTAAACFVVVVGTLNPWRRPRPTCRCWAACSRS